MVKHPPALFTARPATKEGMNVSYPDIVRAELDEAIRRALKNSTFAATEKPLRSRKLTREDTIRFILSMEGGSLQKELYKAGLDVSVSAFVQRRKLLPLICSIKPTLIVYSSRSPGRMKLAPCSIPLMA